MLAQEYVTPAGTLRTGEHPAAATGPDTDQILLGAEGAFGVLCEVTLKVHRYLPENRARFGYLFPDWPVALDAAREVMQGQFGHPALFRLADPAETELALTRHGLDGAALNRLLGFLGLRQGERCLLLGATEGERGFARLARRRIGQICRARGALPTTGRATQAWERGRFRDPCLRDQLQDFGILTDTLECAASWDGLERVRQGVRAYCAARPRTLCLTHLSHAYPQGASLYFIFMARMDGIPEYLAFQAGILHIIRDQGAAMSHHHGIGRMAAPWLEGSDRPRADGPFQGHQAPFRPPGDHEPRRRPGARPDTY